MLQHLVHMHHVEGHVRVAEGEEVGHLKAQVGHPEALRVGLGLRHDVGGGVDADQLDQRSPGGPGRL